MRQLGVLGNSDTGSGETDSVSLKLYLLAGGSLDFSESRVIVAPEGPLGSLRDRIIVAWWADGVSSKPDILLPWRHGGSGKLKLPAPFGRGLLGMLVLLELFCVKQVCFVER